MSAHSPGVLVAIEDGYGLLADTDLEHWARALRAEGWPVELWDYARPDMPSGYFVARYLSGEYGETSLTNPYISFLLHVVDFYDSMQQVRSWLNDGKLVLITNYATAVMAQEALKFDSQPKRAAYFLWCDQILYDTFGLPRPDKTLLIGGDSNELTTKARLFDEMSGVLSRDIKLVDCYRAGHRLPEAEVDHLLLEAIADLLSEAPVKLSNSAQEASQIEDVWLPDLPQPLSKQYQDSINQLLQLREKLHEQLSEAGATEAEQGYARELVTPLALMPLPSLPAVIENVPEVLKGYSQDHRPVRLVSIEPKNEHDLVVDLAFPVSDFSGVELVKTLQSLNFEDKDDLLLQLLPQDHSDFDQEGLATVRYSFELLTSFQTHLAISQAANNSLVSSQTLSPRYEYEMPSFIDEYGATDLYLECFDISMALHSQLEAAGYQAVARYACLRGHRLRWRLAITLADVRDIMQSTAVYEQADIINKVVDILKDRHPILLARLETPVSSAQQET